MLEETIQKLGDENDNPCTLVGFQSLRVYVYSGEGHVNGLRTEAKEEVMTTCSTPGSDFAAAIIDLVP